MTLEQLADLGEFISGIAVIASLIYLAFRGFLQFIDSNQLPTNPSVVLGSICLQRPMGLWTATGRVNNHVCSDWHPIKNVTTHRIGYGT